MSARALPRHGPASAVGAAPGPAERAPASLDRPRPAASTVVVTLSAAGILLVTMGVRQSLGLFVGPLNSATGLGIAVISLAFAIAQLMWGVAQPIAGAIADRYGPTKVLCAGVLLLSLGTALIPFASSGFGLAVALGLLCATGSGAGSFAVLIGAATRQVASERRGKIAGFINAGGSLGQLVFAILSQSLIQLIGWMGAMWSVAALALAALPLTRLVGRAGAAPSPRVPATRTAPWEAARRAARDPSYRLLHAGFFTCGFHIAFLVTHLPGEVDLCGLSPAVASGSLALIGLANVAGSLLAGAATERFRSKYVLAAMYGSRAVLIAGFLLAPKTAWTFYAFAIGLGLTWLATVPPTATIVGKLFGLRNMGTLFGLAILSHQIGGFLGALLGGIVLARTGDYQWMWYADMTLAACAALVNLPIREAPIEPSAVRA